MTRSILLPKRRNVCASGALLLALPLGCGSSELAPHAPEPAATPGSAEVGPSRAAPAPSSSSAAPEPTPLLTDGCASRIDLMLDARQKLDGLERSCIAGMQPIWSEPWVANASGGGAERTVPVADPSSCLRIAAATGPGGAEIELVFLDPDGRPLARDTLDGSVALIGVDGPVCTNRPGPHRLHVRAHGRDTRVAAQVWQAP